MSSYEKDLNGSLRSCRYDESGCGFGNATQCGDGERRGRPDTRLHSRQSRMWTCEVGLIKPLQTFICKHNSAFMNTHPRPPRLHCEDVLKITGSSNHVVLTWSRSWINESTTLGRKCLFALRRCTWEGSKETSGWLLLEIKIGQNPD